MSRLHKLDLREVEVSPDGRYVRFEEKLGSGAYKDVYLAYDTETGKEVAWNTVNLARVPVGEKRRILSETEILASLHHPHIINFYHVWQTPANDAGGDAVVFTTEIVTSWHAQGVHVAREEHQAQGHQEMSALIRTQTRTESSTAHSRVHHPSVVALAAVSSTPPSPLLRPPSCVLSCRVRLPPHTDTPSDHARTLPASAGLNGIEPNPVPASPTTCTRRAIPASSWPAAAPRQRAQRAAASHLRLTITDRCPVLPCPVLPPCLGAGRSCPRWITCTRTRRPSFTAT